MPLIHPNAPADGINTIQTTLNEVLEVDSLPPNLAPSNRKSVFISEPHEVFHCPAQFVVEGHLLRAALPLCLRYVVLVDNHPIEVDLALSNKRYVFSAMHHGPRARQTMEAIQFAESQPQVAETLFELRLLAIPHLHGTLLWLHTTEGAEDLLVAVNDAFGVLAIRHLYTEQELVPILRQATRQ